MASCDICKRNPEGIENNSHCINPEAEGGCKSCPERCGRTPFYIGGMNICSKHMKAFENRITKYWEAAGIPLKTA